MDVTARTYPFERKQPFDMPEEFAWIRANAPVTEVKLADGHPAWLVTRFEDVKAALADSRLARTPPVQGGTALDTGFAADGSSPVFSFGGSIAEGQGHTRWRRVVNRAFTQRQANGMRPRIAEHVGSVLDEIEARGARFDLMADFAYEIPIRVICELLGIPDENRPEFVALAAGLTRRDLQSSYSDFGVALSGMGRYAIRLIGRKRGNLDDDLLSTLIGLHDDDGSQLTNEELVSTVILLLMAGYESTAVQLGNAFFALFHHPDQLARLMTEPALIESGVEEMLRFAQMGTGFAVAKFAIENIELGGARIPVGATVFVSLGSANRDEDVFGPDADRFDLARAAAQRQLAFSNGPHYCLGAALARTELAECIGGLVARFPRIAFDGDLSEVVLASNLFTYYPRALPVVT
jgi:cytochrome P450